MKYERIARPASPKPRATQAHPDRDAGQSERLVRDRPGGAFTDADPDHPALVVGNYLLGGGGLSSRLADRVRQKDGLSYGVVSQYNASPNDPSATFAAFAITNPTNIDKVHAAVNEEIARFVKDGPSETELADGKKAYLESQKVSRTSDAGLANQLANGLFLGRTMAHEAEQEATIDKLTAGDVRKAFEKFLDPKRVVTVEAGDFTKKK